MSNKIFDELILYVFLKCPLTKENKLISVSKIMRDIRRNKEQIKPKLIPRRKISSNAM